MDEKNIVSQDMKGNVEGVVTRPRASHIRSKVINILRFLSLPSTQES